jgi:glutamate formiminotransferase/formiminotetrahydrofolate cyclodeaminase
MKRIIECVPNFSEGRDMSVIKQITDEIEKVSGVELLDVDPGNATNRTVVTMAGDPDAVIEAAFQAVKKASELIDMSKHKGAHPRFGATDVCPLIPISGITMDETVVYARKLAERIGKELKIPIYCYEYAAFKPERKNLANVRSGEYEGLKEKLTNPEWKPDFGPAEFNHRTGATAVSARDFLVAFNVNLNTTSTRRANSIAFDVRETGRVKTENGKPDGKPVLDKEGNPVYIPGKLKSVKAIGWYIEEFGIAQISINLTNINITPVHIAFDEVCRSATERGIRATGSELVGLIPLKSMLDAGKYFLKKQQRSTGVSEKELIKIAIKSMGLDDLYKFKPEEKIIEYVIADKTAKKLVDLTCTGFTDETASESPAPGGGSVSAYVGSLGIALGIMVANLSSHKRGWDDRWEEFSDWADKGRAYLDKLLFLVDEDTRAYNMIFEAFGLPKNSEEEKAARSKAIQAATKYAIKVPFDVMKTTFDAMPVIRAMAEHGNPNSASDAGVGALCALAAIKGAYLNVKINSGSLKDKEFVNKVVEEGARLLKEAEKIQEETLAFVEANIKI